MQKIKVLFVCLGNICRSPMAEAIFNHKIAEKGLEDYFESDSAGTASYHIGKGADKRTISTVTQMGIRIAHSARQVSTSDLAFYDYILAMDAENRQNLNILAKADKALGGKIYLMRDFEPQAGHHSIDSEKQRTTKNQTISAQQPEPMSRQLSVPDPYYGGDEGFQEVYTVLDRTIEHFIDFVRQKHRF